MTETIWIVAVTPPPTTGMTTVTASIAKELERVCQVKTCAISRKTQIADWQWKLSKQFKLVLQTLLCCVSGGPRDIIYVTPDSGLGLIGTILSVLCVKLLNRRLIIHHHVFRYFREATILSRCLFRLTKSRAVHVVLGPEMEFGLKRLYGSDYAVVCRSNAIGVPSEVTVARSRQLGTIGFLSNLTWSKGVGDFLQLAATEISGPCALRFVLAGPAPDQDVRRAIEDAVRQRGDRLTWLGSVRGAPKQAFFDSIDLLLFPTRYANEAAPLTIYEALGQGVPVLARAIGCIPSMVNDNPAFLVSPEKDFVFFAAQSLAFYCQDAASFREIQRDAYKLALGAKNEQQALSWIDALSASLRSM